MLYGSLRHPELSAEGLASPAKLAACDREPIHLSGAIQPHGVLLAIDPETLRIEAISANADGLGGPGRPLLGRPVGAVLGAELEAILRAASLAETPHAPLAQRVLLPGPEEPAAFELAMHRRGRHLLLELEPAGPASEAGETGFAQAQFAASRTLHEAENVERLCEVVVQQIQRLSGFDRVMVYRFDPDAHGSIVAEARTAGTESYLGLHYPASDIPRQARLLYLRSWIRVIPDCGYEPVPLVTLAEVGGADRIDLSMAVLRSVSPLHVQYLKNMGVAASMSISLIVDNQLWGLIACHHGTPRRVGHMQRLAFEALGQQVSARLRAAELAAGHARARQLGRLSTQVISAMTSAQDAARGATDAGEALLGMAEADAVVVELEGRRVALGAVPPTEQLEPLIASIAARAGAGPAPWYTDRMPALPDLPMPADALPKQATGAMYLPLPGPGHNYILWLRGEQAETVRWAGRPEPDKENALTPLAPRASFAEWQEQVRGTSRPWCAAEVAVATELAQAMPEVQMHRNQSRLLRLALHDPLTGLPNRVHLVDRLEQMLEPGRAPASAATGQLGLLFVDLDGFKAVNDTLGHATGDALLVEVARRLTGLIRSQDFAARMGGDEFVVAVPGATLREAGSVAERIIRAFRRPFMLQGQKRRLMTLSIGVTAVPHGTAPTEALRQADEAMYHAKRSGRDRVATYDPVTRAAVNSQALAADELRRAIAAGEIAPFFQPVFDITAPGPPVLHGHEALARWRHPERGLILPHTFIRLAEESDLIAELGLAILRRALDHLRAQRDRSLLVAVNISVRQLMQSDCAETILAELIERGLEPARLCVEITESQMMEEPELVLAALRQLSEAGVRIAIDDFGTGFSSLAYVRNLPAAKLKIDRTFVMGLPGNVRDAAVVRATIELAHALGMRTIAEGVETEAQLDHLRAAGCDMVQGFLLGRPEPV